jgi:hypothetical protein
VTPKRWGLAALVAGAALVMWRSDAGFLKVAAAAAISWYLFRIGLAVLGSFARPVPGPPPPGELRRVRLLYRCSLCGTEVRMTVANDESPEPPRHCMEDMEEVAPAIE